MLIIILHAKLSILSQVYVKVNTEFLTSLSEYYFAFTRHNNLSLRSLAFSLFQFNLYINVVNRYSLRYIKLKANVNYI